MNDDERTVVHAANRPLIENKAIRMSGEDKNYYRMRAEVELKRASNAACPEAVKVHYVLAGHYLDRAHGGITPDDSINFVERQ